MRKLNFIFLAILLSTVAITGGGLYVVHSYQIRRNASALLERAHAAEAQNDLVDTEKWLGWYLNLQRNNGPVWAWYAQVVDQQDTERRRAEKSFLVNQEALRHNQGDRQLERRCAKLAMEIGRHGDAQRLLSDLLKGIPGELEERAKATERADLEELLSKCDRAMARFEDAKSWLELAIKHDPERVDCYDQLARLLRLDLRRNEAADQTIREMIAKNNGSGRAYIHRWRYARAYTPPANAGDIWMALRLAPQDPEVLFTAAVASEEKRDAASARTYFQKGFEIAPKNSAFALGLASLEIRENHLDQAEAILRRAYQVNPSLDLAFELGEILILQDKIEGNDQAADMIARLRQARLSDYVGYLEARILFQQKKWAEAIPRLEMSRTVLRSNPRLMPRLDLMLAECYGRMGYDEQRLNAIRNAGEGEGGSESARIELAQALARSGKLDQAIGILLPLIDRNPELRLVLVRLLIRKATREPEHPGKWEQVEGQLRQAETALPRSIEPLTFLRLDLLTAQNRLDDARTVLNAAMTKEPRVLSYRLALARLVQRQGQGAQALQVLDQAEKGLGPGLAIQLARLSYWDQQAGDAAKVAVAKLAGTHLQVPTADRPAFLDRLASVELHLGELALAREHSRELARLQPENLQVLMGLFDLAMQVADDTDSQDLVARIRKIEGERGTIWRFAQASFLLDRTRRGVNTDLKAAQELAAEIAAQRPEWWGNSVLLAEIAELHQGQTDEAIKQYTRAIELGNIQPALTRRLVGLLNERKDFDQIERVVKILSDRGVTAGDLIATAAIQAIRQQDYVRGIALARKAFSESSINYADHLYLGQFYLAARQPEKAGQELRRAVELGPGVPITWVSYVQYLVLEKQVGQARAAVDAARKALPTDRANLALAQCYGLLGDTKQADGMIQAALQSPACDLATIRIATDLYINLGRFDQVEPILEKLRSPAMKATPEVLAWANRTRSLALLSTGRLDEMNRAMALVEENLKANPSSSEDLRLKAILLALRTSRRADAIKLLEPLEASNQLRANEQFILAQTYLVEGLADKYRDQMLKVLGAGVRNPRHLAHFIDFLMGRRDLDQADHWLAEWKRMAPESLGLFERGARLLDLRGRRPELLDLLQARSRQVPDEIGVVAGLLERFGFAGEAESAYKAFVVRKPSEPERVLVLASFLARQNRTLEAVAILDKAWKTCRPEAVAGASLMLFMAPSADEKVKRQVEAWVSEAIQKSPKAAAPLRPKLATIYLRQGRYGEAETLFRQILNSEPDNVETLNNLAWQLALREPGEPREALALIDRAIEKAGRASTLVDTRAVALIRVGEPDRALQELRDAQVADPKNVSLALHEAWACQAIGKAAEAQKAFQHAGELGLKPEARDPLERRIIERLRSQSTTNPLSPSKRG